MKILGFDFSSIQRSVAFVQTGPGKENLSVEAVETGGRAANAFAMAESVLAQAQVEREQIECIAVGIGPGSYTGIRAAIALAQGWELARQVKLVGISSAEAIAAEAFEQGLREPVAVIIDAQRTEFYVSEYELGASDTRELTGLRLASLQDVRAVEERGFLMVGPEVNKWFPAGRVLFPRAAWVAQLAGRARDFVTGETLLPIYLRQTTFVKAPPARIVPDKA